MATKIWVIAFVLGIISVFGVYIFFQFFLDLFDMKITRKKKESKNGKRN